MIRRIRIIIKIQIVKIVLIAIVIFVSGTSAQKNIDYVSSNRNGQKEDKNLNKERRAYFRISPGFFVSPSSFQSSFGFFGELGVLVKYFYFGLAINYHEKDEESGRIHIYNALPGASLFYINEKLKPNNFLKFGFGVALGIWYHMAYKEEKIDANVNNYVRTFSIDDLYFVSPIINVQVGKNRVNFVTQINGLIGNGLLTLFNFKCAIDI